MNEIIIFDFEVFKHDTLLGALVLSQGNTEFFQSWNLKKIIDFYERHKDAIWVGHNNDHYDNHILQAVVDGKSEEEIRRVNDQIIREDKKMWLKLPLNFYDLISSHWVGLKTMEAYDGKDISETEVDFMLDRKLTEEEKKLTEQYNADDLDQTLDDFIRLRGDFTLRLDVINEFKLPLKNLAVTGTRLAEEVLHATKIPDIETWVKPPTMWPNLRIKNPVIIDFYLHGKWSWTIPKAQQESLNVTLCGTEHTIASGGIHGAKRKVHIDEALYFDVSGYYNLIMILLDLLPRSIPPEYRKEYENMYHKQLELKKTDPGKRGVYKTILLSVFGAMNNKYCRFYDPYNGDLVRMSGQMFLVDLLEKLEGMVDVIQSNTDGVIAVPLEGVSEEQVLEVINEWQTRTGFVLKLDKIYDIHQRDVNTYMYRDKCGEIHVVGDTITHYGKLDWPFWKDSFNAKEPLIVAYGIVEYFMNGVFPEDYVENNKRNLRMFQYLCKKLSFDYCEYEEVDIATGNIKSTIVQNVNRAFALKSDKVRGMIYKRRAVGKTTKAKVSNLPDSVFIHNEEILSDEAIDSIMPQINYDYYVDRIYEKIAAFYPFEEGEE